MTLSVTTLSIMVERYSECRLCVSIILNTALRTIFAKLHFPFNLHMNPISLSFCPWQAYPAYCNVTPKFIGSIHKLQRKSSVVTAAKVTVFITLHFLHNV